MKIIAYYRQSTKGQADSGLGLDAQRTAVQRLASERRATIVAEYTETESGRLSDRPKLTEALSHAKLARATLVVAKLDRLTRNVGFLSKILESKADFLACDMPAANTVMLQTMTIFAEQEARAISERTKVALAAAKARGVKLGSARPGHWYGRSERRRAGLEKAIEVSARARTAAARADYRALLPLIREQREEGQTLQDIADSLNDRGMPTRGGKAWTAMTVHRVLQRG